ncbi:Zn-ribbon domain-containing OB-fold protein [Microtetraspora fusca]|uniref:Zn-ribbon domain-containing OB-fold protein n=1 Tax=Microtetraspora fusca TaxID=1997 RepID=A0ABW6VDG0_MICFU|nr:Zn-ribbon domain-containing OB-fold protein [Microtetraspora fusca]
MTDLYYGDPLSRAFWDGARNGVLVLQRCADCGRWQHYPRPLCLGCESTSLESVPASGSGTIYSCTTVRISARPDLEPPYIAAIVELDEGPRMLTNVAGDTARIGDRVRIGWRHRTDAPPLPIFTVDADA